MSDVMTPDRRTQTAASPSTLDGKVAIANGFEPRVSRASAEAMARLVAKVVISSRKAEACEAAVRDIRQDGGEAPVRRLPGHAPLGSAA
jgi:NAD(P)-dependent dehydrogenase (short-subunit alcohol dehydrogenase family)